jgi:hypothetical protein
VDDNIVHWRLCLVSVNKVDLIRKIREETDVGLSTGGIGFTPRLHLAAVKILPVNFKCEGLRYCTENEQYKCCTKTTTINIQKFTSSNLMLRTTNVTPVKP